MGRWEWAGEGREPHVLSPEACHRHSRQALPECQRHEKGTEMALSILKWSSPVTEPLRVGGTLAGLFSLLPALASPVVHTQLEAVTLLATSQCLVWPCLPGAAAQGGWSPLCHLPSCFRLCPPQTRPQLYTTWSRARLRCDPVMGLAVQTKGVR